jgi:hypothetical protein
MYEHKTQPLLSTSKYYSRIYRSMALFFGLLTICLAIGVLGYHYFAELEWLDSLHNASMILSGMGPVAEIKTVSGKLFSSFYALFSGVAFITNIGLLLTPVVHRFFHKMHVENN